MYTKALRDGFVSYFGFRVNLSDLAVRFRRGRKFVVLVVGGRAAS